MALRLAVALTTVAIAWGALAFGAVYAWAYWTLAALAAAAGIGGLCIPPRRPILSRAMRLALVGVPLAIAAQLIPLPPSIFAKLNPNAASLVSQLDPLFALHGGAHSLSVVPRHTRLALVLCVLMGILLAGTARLASTGGGRRLAERLIVIGGLLALIGIIQKPLYAGRIYGFWTPIQEGSPFGPYVNKNHFAGWMLMGIPVALGYLGAGIARGMRGMRHDWRSRVLWLASTEASKLVLTALTVAVMGLSLVLTMSRSGIVSLSVAIVMTAWFAMRGLTGRAQRLVMIVYLVVLPALLISWAGFANVVGHFHEQGWAGIGSRTGAWADAVATFHRHSLTGIGLNTYQHANLIYQQHDLESFESSAHNDYLQLAAEGGALLLLPVGLCLIVFVRDVRRRFVEDPASSSYWLRAGAVTGLIAIGLQETVDFSLQIPGNAVLWAVLCGLALHRSPQRSQPALSTQP
jgi:O-antigen ligase